MRKNNRDIVAYALIFVFLLICLLGAIRLISFNEPTSADPAFYKVYKDDYVKISISYMNKNKVSSDGTTFVSVRGQSANDLLLFIENLRPDGLIFTPTPEVTIINSKGEVVNNLKPFISVAGFANPNDSTYISFNNPIPAATATTGEYTYVIDLQYHYTFYDKEAYSDNISITVKKEIRTQKTVMEIYNFIKRLFPYLILSASILLVLATSGRKKR